MSSSERFRERVSSDVAETFNRDYCVLTGRATTGLYLLFEALSLDGEIIYPAYTCPSPVYAATYAGGTPSFCDVLDDYTIDTEELKETISDETRAVVPINMFGHPARYDEIQRLCDEHDALLIEDTCQAVGTTYRGTPVGQFGDASVVSFGNKKPLDAGGGGAVLTDDATIAEAVSTLESEMPHREQARLKKLYDTYRKLYWAIEEAADLTDRAHRLFATLPVVFEELYIRGFDYSLLSAIASSIDDYETVVETRRTHADIYQSKMRHERLNHPAPVGDPVYYRYSVTLASQALRDHVVTRLRESDIHVSTLYDPIHQRFGDWNRYETTESLSQQTINLWVSQQVDEQYVHRTAKAVINSMDEFSDE